MFFNKVYFFILIIFLVLGITFFNFSVLKKEYRLINIHMSSFQNLVTLNAENYIEKFNLENEIRFDVISIIMNSKHTEIEHFINAF